MRVVLTGLCGKQSKKGAFCVEFDNNKVRPASLLIGFGSQGLGFRVSGPQGLGFRGSGVRVEGFGVWVSGVQVFESFGSEDQGPGVRVIYFGVDSDDFGGSAPTTRSLCPDRTRSSTSSLRGP